ncbi:hypothetical protein [Paenibacillus sp. MMS18-CY102]|uniref:hypothetical protein n=1 Tax=Paenibacillus sp. MMS18-CY102 TaxID=2682849 RepID=UPI00136595F4|nr:hypothetical protein [Paenibacillus sp. MMS18-CY102]MWC29492.1 hypothetical protein [Paenibacillus sp. MMS18-CY102]
MKKKEIVEVSWNLAGKRTSLTDQTGTTSYAYNTTTSLEVAKRFDSGYGIVAIDLNLVNSEKKVPMYEFWGSSDYEGEIAYAYGVAEQEISVYKYIPSSAIVGYIP